MSISTSGGLGSKREIPEIHALDVDLVIKIPKLCINAQPVRVELARLPS